MSVPQSPNKRTTVYLDPQLHRALSIKALETNRSVSELINDSIRHELAEDQADLAAFEERGAEPVVSFEAVLKELKRHGRI
jgi:predicted transcriptional regulator